MYRFSILFLVFLFSCSSNRPQQSEIPAFVKEKVCSPEALAYFTKPAKKNSTTKFTDAEIRPYMLKMQPFLTNCYEQEMLRTGQNNSFNMCFVSGIDKKGFKEFFQFSTTEVNLSLEMNKCLDAIKNQVDFEKIKDVTILQPFKLFPKK